MSLIDKINHFFLLIIDTVKRIGLWQAWLILIGYFLINWFMLYAHYDFMSPFFYGLMKFWTSLVNPNMSVTFTHYPQHLALLDSYFSWAKLGVGLLFEGLILGFVARLFAGRVFKSGTVAARSLWSLWIQLIIVWFVLNGLWMLIGSQLPSLAQPYLNGPRRLAAFGFVVLPFCFMVVFSLLYYALPAVAIYGDNVFQAIARSLKLFLRRPFTSFFLAALVLIVPTFLAALASRPDQILDKFRPELVYYLLVAGLAVEIPANFLWVGTAVQFLRDTQDQ